MISKSFSRDVYQIHDQTLADFAGNVEVTFVIMPYYWWELVSIQFLLTCGATPGNRVPLLKYGNGSQDYLTIFNPTATIINEIYYYNFAIGVGQATSTHASMKMGSLPADHVMRVQDTLKISVSDGAATDTVANIRMRFKVWQQPNVL
jgi:hypothetical protein